MPLTPIYLDNSMIRRVDSEFIFWSMPCHLYRMIVNSKTFLEDVILHLLNSLWTNVPSFPTFHLEKHFGFFFTPTLTTSPKSFLGSKMYLRFSVAYSIHLLIVCHLSLVRGLQAAAHATKTRPRFRRACIHAKLFLINIYETPSLSEWQVKSCRSLRF